MADMLKMLQQAKAMQERFQQLQAELQQKKVSATAGGGMVTAEADGAGSIRRVRLDPSVVNPADIELLEDLIVVAVAEAQKKAQALQQEEMARLAGGASLPFKLPF
ncbi:MAG: YbaB/EbfC family nucleoid-associated protein [Gemmatimonadaceae bacterium]